MCKQPIFILCQLVFQLTRVDYFRIRIFPSIMCVCVCMCVCAYVLVCRIHMIAYKIDTTED